MTYVAIAVDFLQNHDNSNSSHWQDDGMKREIGFILAVVFFGATLALAGTNDGAWLVQRGLIEEEANHQLEAAIRDYQDALERLGTNRQMVATAVFRLGECYRKEGKTNEALAQYRRILRDFPDQTQLARVSQQFVASPASPPPAFVLSFGNASPNPTNNLKFPGGVTVDASGNVYVSDTHNNRIQKFSSQGEFLTMWGSSGTNAGSFDYPQGLTTDASGNVYVADTHNHRVQKFASSGDFVAQWGRLGSKPGEFNAPYSIAVDSAGNVYVADCHNDRIQKFTTDGAYVSSFGTSGAEAGQLDQPKSVAVDSAGNVYVADTGNKRIEKFNGAGAYLGEWGSYGKLAGQFDLPHDVAVDQWGNIYVADADGDSHNNRIQMFASDGTVLTLWGSLGSGPGQFNFAARVAVDRTGLKIYVCDATNNRIQLFSWGQ